MSEQIARTESQLGAIIRRRRRSAGLTQDALGQQVRLRQATISRLEAGEPALQIKTVMEVLAALSLEIVVRPRSSSKNVVDLF